MRTAKIVQGIATIIIVIVAMTSRRMIKEITSSVPMIILLILRLIAFTSFLRDASLATKGYFRP